MDNNEVSLNWIKERVHDQKHFTARWLETASQASGQTVENCAKVVIGSVVCLLVVTDHQAHFFANLILVLVPFLLIFVYPDEQPSDRSLLVYFITFGFLTVLDRNLEKLPLYYVLKLAILLLLYLPPWSLAEVIEENVKKMVQEEKQHSKEKTDEENNEKAGKRSVRAPPSDRNSLSQRGPNEGLSAPPADPAPPPPPPPPPPPQSTMTAQSTSRSKREEQSVPLKDLAANLEATTEQKDQEEPIPSKGKRDRQSVSLKEVAKITTLTPTPQQIAKDDSYKRSQRMDLPQNLPPVLGERNNEREPERELAVPSRSGSDLADGSSRRIKVGQNPMAIGSFHQLKSETDGFNSNLIGPENNLHDLIFLPMNSLIFNAPFDFDNLTYHMKIHNNSHHRIAYAVKGNAVPRVMVYPTVGIFELRETKMFAVTVQKFDYNFTDFEKDRIAFDYVILPDNVRDQQFSMKMFQHADSKRRKNIKILYNP